MRIPGGSDLEMERQHPMHGQRAEKFFEQLRGKCARMEKREGGEIGCSQGQERPAAHVDRRLRQCLVHRHQGKSVAANAFFIAEGLLHRLAEADADVLYGVVEVDLSIATGMHLEIKEPMAGKKLEHMVEEGNARPDLASSGAVQAEQEGDFRFLRRSLDPRCSMGGHTHSVAEAASSAKNNGLGAKCIGPSPCRRRIRSAPPDTALESVARSAKVWSRMPPAQDSGNERILAIAIGHRWFEEARLPAIRAALATLPEANAADLLHEQGMIDSAQRAWLRQQEASEPQRAHGEPFVDQCLREAALQGCSDLHLAPDRPPLCRRHGRLRSLGRGWSALSAQHVAEIVERTLSAHGRESLARLGWASLPYAGGRMRARLTVGRDATGYFLSFRLPFPHSPELSELGMEATMALATIPSGLIIVAGGPGQGKSTLLTALGRQVRRSRPGRVVILEDLPEHAWEDAPPRPIRIAFAELHGERDEVLRAAFTMDPDVLLLDISIGPSTLPLLVEETARSGALVMATLGLCGVAEVLRSLCAEMPQEASRSLLVRTLRAIIALELIPGATGKERVSATELFRNVPAASAALTKAKPERIESVLDVGEGKHFQPIDDSLWRLFQESRITMEAAYARCRYRPRWVARMHAPDFPGAL